MTAIRTNNAFAHRLRTGTVWAAPILLIALWLHPQLTMAQTTINSNAAPVITNVAGGGFENPLLAANGYQTNPAAPGWTFGGTHAGISRNGSGFTSGNPTAPEGLQVLYLQISGSAATTINFPASGYYRFSCKAARRANWGGVQTFRLSIDNNTFDTIKPADNNYQLYKTTAVFITAGNHELKLTGNTIPTTGDNTAFVDDLKMERLASWSSASSWTGGVVPSTTSHRAVIDANETVVLDVNTTVKSVEVLGQLIAAKDLKNLNLTADWIMVNGSQALLEWGTATAPFTGNAAITLTGTNTGVQVNGWGVGEKFLGARQGGVIEMHGTNKTSWTQLSATAAAGATSVTLKDPVPSWNIGDQFVIASTDFNPAQAEVRTITGKSADNRAIFFSGGLSYMHYGVTQSYSGGTYILDERAEVGLLTRNIRIVGSSPGTAGFGGHCMFVENAKVRFSGVEFYNMGQKGIKGRYPFHWHELGDINGQYIKNSSINLSFNRAVAVHTSSNGLIEDNVAYDHIGHGFYLEDQGAVNNTFRHNLGLLTRRPVPSQAVEPHDTANADNGLFKTPATFWVNHPNNHFIDNAAAGSEGSGIWFLGKNNLPMGTVTDNRAHSNTFNFTVDGNIDAAGNLGFGHFRPPAGTTPYINRFTSFKARERGLWTRGDSMVFNNCRLADCPRNDFFAYNQQLHNSLIVGKSGNTGTSSFFTANETAAGRSLALPNQPATHEFNIFYGHSLYDGPSGAKNVHFAGFNGNNAFAFSIFAAAQKSPLHWAESISFEAGTAEVNKIQFNKSTDAEMMYTSGLVDRNGSITGTAGAVLTPRILPNPAGSTKIHEDGFNRRPNATLNNTWNAYINPTSGPFRLLRIDEHTKNAACWYTTHPQYNIRSDGPATYGWPTDFAGKCSTDCISNCAPSWHQNPVIVNDNAYKYFWQRHKIPNRAEAVLRFGNMNDYVISVFPNMPSYTYVYGAITNTGGNNSGTALPRVNTLALLESSTQQAYYLANNTLYVKHIANTAGWPEENVPFGHDKKSNPINICLLPNCGTTANQTGELAEAVFADLEQQGGDSRFAASVNARLTVPSLNFDATTAGSATDGVDNKVSWTVTKVADAFDDYVDVRINVPRQIWWDFNHIRFNITGVNFEVWVNDGNQGLRNLGTFAPGANAAIPVNVPLNPALNSAYLDNVTALIIRVKESAITGAAATMNLFNISLNVNAPGAVAPPAGAVAAETVTAMDTPGKLSVYPNPASGSVTVSGWFKQTELVEIQVLNSEGRTVHTEKQRVNAGKWNYRLLLPPLPDGPYILRVSGSSSGINNAKLQVIN